MAALWALTLKREDGEEEEEGGEEGEDGGELLGGRASMAGISTVRHSWT